ncbi:hypothetical protein PFISCL1PPCAC_12626, partial [Pristionchus fissidentatus]
RTMPLDVDRVEIGCEKGGEEVTEVAAVAAPVAAPPTRPSKGDFEEDEYDVDIVEKNEEERKKGVDKGEVAAAAAAVAAPPTPPSKRDLEDDNDLLLSHAVAERMKRMTVRDKIVSGRDIPFTREEEVVTVEEEEGEESEEEENDSMPIPSESYDNVKMKEEEEKENSDVIVNGEKGRKNSCGGVMADENTVIDQE